MSDSTTPQDDKAMSPASDGSRNTHMATARLSAANTWLQEEIKRLRLTDEEREAIALAKSRLGTSDGDWHADDVLAALLERLG
jgi:hypothetical protein